MSATIAAKPYMSFIPKGVLTINPTLYARFVPKGVLCVKPVGSYVSFVPEPVIAMASADTERTVSAVETMQAASVRELTRNENIAADAKRNVAVTQERAVATVRELANTVTASADTERTVNVTEEADADTLRMLTKFETASAETIRKVQDLSRDTVAEADTFRAISTINESRAETLRSLTTLQTAESSTERDIYATATISASAARQIYRTGSTSAETVRDVFSTSVVNVGAIRTLSNIETAIAETVRTPALFNVIEADTYREIFKVERFNADVARKIPYILRESGAHTLEAYTAAGIQSISVTLGERTLSDVFEMTTVKPMDIEDAIIGSLLDYEYRFLVEETSRQNLVQTVKGMYGVDEMLYTPFSVTAGGTMCSTYIRQIAEALGLNLISSFEDYEMAQDYSESGMTYQDLISALFGWTSRFPQRQINVFIRGNNLHVLQRGMESSTLDITGWPHTRPTVNRKLVRSVWNNRTNSDDDFNNRARSDADDEQIPFTGTIGVGKVYLRYVGGYLVHEENNGDETTYTYDGEYLVSKTSRRKDGTVIKTEYEYYHTENDVYLMVETETTDTSNVDPKDDSGDDDTISTRSTYHAPIGSGWYLTSVYVDGEFQGSSLSQGPPGGKASQYMVDAMNRHLSRTAGTPSEPITLSGTSLIDTSFPVKGDVFLRKLTLAIEWLNRKVQEEVSLEIVSNVRNGVPEITHVVDFTERVKLDGREYFLVSNNIELTPRSLRQRLRLVRWSASRSPV